MALVLSKEFLDIQATIECEFTLKRVRDMIITYSHNDMLLNNICLRLSVNKSQSEDHRIQTYEINKVLMTKSISKRMDRMD